MDVGTKRAYDILQGRTDTQGVQQARSMERYLKRFAEHGPDSLDQKMMKALGRKKDGEGKPVQVFEFKAYQWRLYGVIKNYKGERAFIGLGFDDAKKKNKANPAKIESAAKRSSSIRDESNGKGN